MQDIWSLTFNVLLVASAFVFSLPQQKQGCVSNSATGGCHESLNMEGNHKRDAGECFIDEKKISQGESIYRLINNTLSTTSVDICFAISATTTTPSYEWTQTLAMEFDKKLKDMGIGVQDNEQNRFCVIQFGARNELLRAKIIPVKSQIFFSAENFPENRLKNNGFVADGYEALEFILQNIPFRENPSVAKGVVLASGTGRTILADRINLTKPLMLQLLQDSNICLDIITKMTVQQPGIALGMLDYSSLLQYHEANNYEEINSPIDIISSHGNTINDYVSLAFQSGGSAWFLDSLTNSTEIIKGFAAAYVDSRSYIKSTMCQICSCGSENEDMLSCTIPSNQRACRACINQTTEQCLATQLITDYQLLQLTTTVSRKQHSKEVNISFHSNREDVVYSCIHLNSSSPLIHYCTSPVTFSDLSGGFHQFLIIGKTLDGFKKSHMIEFQVPEDYPTINISITDKIPHTNGSVVLHFDVVTTHESHVTVMCSIDEGPFSQCNSPFEVVPIDGNSEANVTLVASDRKGGVTVRKETVTFPENSGPVQVTVTSSSVNVYGVLQIRFKTSRSAMCICIIKQHWSSCSGKFDADPSDKNVGSGDHTLMITCRDSNNYYDTEIVEVHLDPPPQIPNTALECSLALHGPFSNGSVIAEFDCNRPTSATCTIGSLPSQTCTGTYSFNTHSLLPGYHLFTLRSSDGFGYHSTNLNPFYIAAPDRQCCPQLIRDTAVANVEGDTVNLSVDTGPGNCTVGEGFSYHVTWGDGSSYKGISAIYSSPLVLTRVYTSRGQYTAALTYCNNPQDEKFLCCDTIHTPFSVTTIS